MLTHHESAQETAYAVGLALGGMTLAVLAPITAPAIGLMLLVGGARRGRERATGVVLATSGAALLGMSAMVLVFLVRV